MLDIVLDHIVQDPRHQIVMFSFELLILLIKLVGSNSSLFLFLLGIHGQSLHFGVILRYGELLEKSEWGCIAPAPYYMCGLGLPEFLSHLVERF